MTSDQPPTATEERGERGRGAAPPIGLFELVLEVANLPAAERFYRDVIGLDVVERWEDDRPASWLAFGSGSFLGLWPPETGGAVAIHQSRGGAHVHFAIRVPRGTLYAVQARLEARSIQSKRAGNSGRATAPSTSTTPTATSSN